MFFKYTGVENGRKVSAVVESGSLETARAQLRSRGIMIFEIEETRSAAATGKMKPRSGLERALSGLFIGKEELEQAFCQIVILLKGDVPVVEALDTAVTLSKGMLAQALFEVSRQVKDGCSLSGAMTAKMPFVGVLQLGLIEVGEANGSLPQMFTYCVNLMEQSRALRNKIIQSMIYPAIVVLMGLGVGYYVSVVAIPKIATVLEGDVSRLPAMTRALLVSSDWVLENGLWLLVVPAAVSIGLLLLRRNSKAALSMDYILLKVPMFGKVFQFAANALWNRTLAALLDSGVTVAASLDLTRKTLTNRYYRKQFKQVGALVLAGKSLSAGLERTALKKLSPLSHSLVRVGENSGNLDEGLRYVGSYYEDGLERHLDLLSKMVEPALIVIVGGMVAFVYVAFFMGMAAMNTAM